MTNGKENFAKVCENRELIFSAFRFFGSIRGTYLTLCIYNMLDFYDDGFSGQMLLILFLKGNKKRVVRAGINLPLRSASSLIGSII